MTPWRELLLSRQTEQAEDFPNHHVSDPDSLITTCLPRGIYVGTGHSIFQRALLPALLEAKESIHFVTCFWASSPSLDAIRETLVELAARRVQQAKPDTLYITIGFSSRSFFQKLFHTPSRLGHLYPPAQWPKLGLPEESLLGKAKIQLTVKSLFFTPFSVMHPKYVIIDDTTAFFPSCNVSWERWFEGCLELQGDVVLQLLAFHRATWGSGFGRDSTAGPEPPQPHIASHHTQSSSSRPVPLPHSEPTTGISLPATSDEQSPIQFESFSSSSPVPTILCPSSHHRNPRFAIIPFLSPKEPPVTPLNAALKTLFDIAQQSITILTPNLTCWVVLDALLEALARGVDVQIRTSKNMMLVEQLLTAGTTTSRCIDKLVSRYKKLRTRTQQTDLEVQSPALGSLDILYYKPLASRSQLDDEPVVSHFKMTLVDRQYLVLGSGNMDRASWFTSQELGLLLYMPDFQGNRLWDDVLEKRTEVAYQSSRDAPADNGLR